MSPQRCRFCKRLFQTTRSLKLHLVRSRKGCKTFWQQEVECDLPRLGSASGGALLSTDSFFFADQDGDWPQPDLVHISCRSRSPDHTSEQPKKRTRLDTWIADGEDVPERYVRAYHGRVAESLGTVKTSFQQRYETQQALGLAPWAPFSDTDEWELARFLVESVNKKEAQRFLKLSIVCLDIKLMHSSNGLLRLSDWSFHTQAHTCYIRRLICFRLVQSGLIERSH
jgi:hypothetical protein